MKRIWRLYRVLKPVCIGTSYLFTSMTILLLLLYTLCGKEAYLPVEAVWMLLLLSFGSSALQKLLLNSRMSERFWYPARFAVYLCLAAALAYGCLFVLMADRLPVSGRFAVIPILAAGILCCGGLELFNRYRMHMYNTLLEQYKKRKRL